MLSVLDAFRPGQFFIYYDKPSGAEMPVAIELKIGYMTSANEVLSRDRELIPGTRTGTRAVI